MRRNIFHIFLLLLLVVLSSCGSENKTVAKSPSLGEISIETMVKEKKPIILGVVTGEGGESFGYKYKNSPMAYHEIYVEVVSCYSANFQPGEVLTFYEFGGEAEGVYCLGLGPDFQVGDTILIAALEKDFIVASMSAFFVTENTVSIPSDLLPEPYFATQGTTTFTLEELNTMIASIR